MHHIILDGCPAEITYFRNTHYHDYVLRFQITMDDLISVNIHQGVCNLVNYLGSFFLSNS